jgi:uncharacterized membrane protein
VVEARGINDAGDIVGSYNTDHLQGFLRLPDGSFFAINLPGNPVSIAQGVNNLGLVVGYYETAAGESGYLRLGDGTFRSLSITPYTDALGINDAGQIVGAYSDSSGSHGFLRSPDGSITTIDIPGASDTVATGINNLGEICGIYSLASGGMGGFLRAIDGTITTFVPVFPGEGVDSFLVEGINDSGQMTGYITITLPEPASWQFLGSGLISLLAIAGIRCTRRKR